MATGSFLMDPAFRFERALRRRRERCWEAESEPPSSASGVGVNGVFGGSGGCVKWKRGRSLAGAFSGSVSRVPGAGGRESSARDSRVFTAFMSAPANK